ncbi:DUF3046 domain-containing protein [Agromyces sp. LHK192]|uniref:DUF3046 domain-containing protein n=1 Tax=Agromyces sp. LHK192 TaxID=2498704 RepID=UPI000FDC3C35|nr:DUF3046 domain-containing protein [Agromyces sp. LHK192]
MKRSEFQVAIDEEFGPGYGGALVRDLTMEALGGRTAREALDAGIPPREVWLALCAATDVPVERRHGVGQREPGRHG